MHINLSDLLLSCNQKIEFIKNQVDSINRNNTGQIILPMT